MKTSNDILRQASRYTMHGLIDPRLLEPAEHASKENPMSKLISFVVNRIVSLKRTTASH
ncbi:MAG TPA: hypothetical protein VGK59_20460 [Ohtaekwangia sp.]